MSFFLPLRCMVSASILTFSKCNHTGCYSGRFYTQPKQVMSSKYLQIDNWSNNSFFKGLYVNFPGLLLLIRTHIWCMYALSVPSSHSGPITMSIFEEIYTTNAGSAYVTPNVVDSWSKILWVVSGNHLQPMHIVRMFMYHTRKNITVVSVKHELCSWRNSFKSTLYKMSIICTEVCSKYSALIRFIEALLLSAVVPP